MNIQHEIPVAWAPPFSSGPVCRDVMPEGFTISEIVASMPALPLRFKTHGVVMVNGEEVPRHMWDYVKPKSGGSDLPVAVTLHMPLAGGGGGKGRSIFGLIAIIALVAITRNPAFLSAIGPAASALGVSAATLASGIALAGTIAIGALTAPPSLSNQGTDSTSQASDGKDSASINGNILQKGAQIPRVIGTHKVFPPFACEPLVMLSGEDEYVEAVFCLAGPHDLSGIRIDNAPIDESDNVEYEVREGWGDDTPLSLVTRQARTQTPNIELSSIAVDPGDKTGNSLRDQTAPETDLPLWHNLLTRGGPDQITVHLSLGEGLYDTANPDAVVFLPIRMRFRKFGDTAWINAPEMHVAGNKAATMNLAVDFKWETAPSPPPNPGQDRGLIRAYKEVPAQTIGPAFDGWSANGYFSSGAGNDYLDIGSVGTTKIINFTLEPNVATVYLNEATFPKGRYEIQFMAGAAINLTDFTVATYLIGGVVKSPFHYWLDSSTYRPADDQNKGRRIAIYRLISIWNEHPIATTGLALIAIRAKNQSINNLSTIASGYVKDWDGTGWNEWKITSNPAPHYVDVLSGQENLDPLPDEIRDDPAIVAWRSECITNGYTCDMVVEGQSITDTLKTIAACGYAANYQSELWGVAQDNDKSADLPVQVFSRRNANSFKIEKAFTRLPDGFRVKFRDAADDYSDKEVLVYADGYSGGPDGRFEEVSYDGIVSEDRAIVRAAYDLKQATLRSSFYTQQVPAEHLVARKGDLVAVQHDILDSLAGDARIKAVTLNVGGDVSGLTLDSKVSIINEPDMLAVANMLAVADMLNVGLKTGIMIRETDGSISTHALSNTTGFTNAVTLQTPVTNTMVPIDEPGGTVNYPAIDVGNLVVLGAVSSEYRRLVLLDVTPGADMTAQITMVDEAPGLVRTP